MASQHKTHRQRATRRRLLAAIAGMACGALALPREASAASLKLGLLPYLNTRTLIQNYTPLAAFLGKALGLGVQLETAPDFTTFVQRAFRGDYDLMLMAPHYARLAEVEYGYRPLLIHKTPIRALLIVAKHQPLASVADLRGTTLAVHERSAIIAILGVSWLRDHGLEENRDYHFVQTVTHSSALLHVQSGRARAALVSYSTLIQAPAELQQNIDIAYEYARIPGLYLLAHPRLAPAQTQAVRAALIRFEQSPEGQAFFKTTGHGGYREVSPEDARLLDRSLPETRRLLGHP